MMPWAAIPFREREAAKHALELLGGDGDLPKLVILDGNTGAIVCSDAMPTVVSAEEHPMDAVEAWDKGEGWGCGPPHEVEGQEKTVDEIWQQEQQNQQYEQYLQQHYQHLDREEQAEGIHPQPLAEQGGRGSQSHAGGYGGEQIGYGTQGGYGQPPVGGYGHMDVSGGQHGGGYSQQPHYSDPHLNPHYHHQQQQHQHQHHHHPHPQLDPHYHHQQQQQQHQHHHHSHSQLDPHYHQQQQQQHQYYHHPQEPPSYQRGEENAGGSGGPFPDFYTPSFRQNVVNASVQNIQSIQANVQSIQSGHHDDEQARSLERLRSEAQQMKDEADRLRKRAQTEMAKKEDEMKRLKEEAKKREEELRATQEQLERDRNALLTLTTEKEQAESKEKKDAAELSIKLAELEKQRHEETQGLQQAQQAKIEKLMQEMNNRDAKLAQMDLHKRQLEKEKKRRERELSHVIKSKDAEIARSSDQKKVTEQMMNMKEQMAKQMEEERAKLESEIREAKGASEKAQEAFYREQALRKKYLHELEQVKGAIRVFCRVRPLSTSEKDMNSSNCARFPDEQEIQLQAQNGTKGKTFAFDKVFGPESKQEDVFQPMLPLVQSAMDGYNVCIFAYGQTGSGKTYTMENPGGSPSTEGITPRAVAELFRIKAREVDRFDMRIKFSMMELYNDKLLDLLESTGKKLAVKKDADGMTFVENAAVREVDSAEELKETIRLGGERRHVSSTKMNAESSRSHLVMSVLIESNKRGTNSDISTVGKLTLVDLAGSERQAKTGSANESLAEAQSINKSLSALGDVVHALTSKAKFIPYRNNLVHSAVWCACVCVCVCVLYWFVCPLF
jgi:hypothetical protein